MKNQSNMITNSVKKQISFKVFAGIILLALTGLTACNSNTNGGKTTASHDTSSAVSNRVDTMGGGSKQP